MIPYTMYNDNVQLRTEIERLRKERDELLSALEYANSRIGWSSEESAKEWIERVEKVIASIKGGE